MGQKFRVVIAALIGVGALAAPALAQNDPPGRIARLAFTEGTVSFHDDEQSDWTRAAVNTPLTTGDSIWTEAGARSEISLAGTRVRLDGGTQLDLLAIDDTQTRMQVAQGRWANRNNRCVWVPPQRDQRPVYAPALVAFIGGIELSISLGNPSRAPVGWFPLAPREAYVPPYTTNQNYYRNVNRSDRIEQAMLNEGWQRAQSREAMPDRQRADQQRFVLANQRFATVVAAEDFVRSRPVARATIQVAPEKLAAAPVARVSAPPAPTQSVNAAPAPAANAPAANAPAAKPTDSKTGDPKTADPKAADPKAQADAKAEADAKAKTEASAKASNVPVTQTQAGGMATLGKPADSDRPKAPGPKVASRPNEPAAAGAPAGTPQNRPAAAPPPLQPRVGNAPPELKGDRTPAAPAKPSQPEAKAPAANDNKATTAPTTPQPQPPVAAPPAAKAEPAKPAPSVATPAAPATPATPAP